MAFDNATFLSKQPAVFPRLILLCPSTQPKFAAHGDAPAAAVIYASDERPAADALGQACARRRSLALPFPVASTSADAIVSLPFARFKWRREETPDWKTSNCSRLQRTPGGTKPTQKQWRAWHFYGGTHRIELRRTVAFRRAM